MKRFLTLLTLILASQNANAGVFDGTQGEGTEISPYLIYNITDLKEVADTINLTNVFNRNFHFKLMADITTPVDFSIGHNNPQITHRFSHSFDGNMYKITVAINTSQYVALFGFIDSNGVIKNLSVDGEVISATGEVGSIAGRNYGIIQNCTNYASINSSLIAHAGGIVGVNYGIIQNCINYGEIIGNLYAGGIVGVMSAGLLFGCINAANVTGTTITGGIVGYATGAQGYNDGVIITNCLNIGTIICDNYVGGIVGRAVRTDNRDPAMFIQNCVNAGFIKGTGQNNATAGIVCIFFAPSSAGADIIISNSINTGVVEGNNNVSAIISFVGTSTSLTLTNCHYDKQFCNHKGVNGVDIIGQAEGHLTRNMVGRKLASLLGDIDWTYVERATLIECLYPQLKVLDNTDASKVGATPIFLYDGIKD
ncbi:MAG: hypothetical protein FWG85_00760 [Bacteroidetes bacterium]|nr:hypothetical protein [Bacteroidota bacterium]